MALQFVFGGSGSGKSHYLYQNITKEAEENPSLSYLVLVPEQFTMQTLERPCYARQQEGNHEY